MAIAYVKAGGTADTGVDVGIPAVITVPAGGHAAGDFLVIGFINNGDIADGSNPGTITDSKGNTYAIDVTKDDPGNHRTARTATAQLTNALASGDTITIPWTGFTNVVAASHEYSGIATSSALDKTASALTSFGTTHSSGNTAATTQADELLLGVHLLAANVAWTPVTDTAVTDTFGTSFTAKLIIQYRIVAATGTYASSGTTAAGQDTIDEIATYKGAAAVGAQNVIAWTVA